jgi:hypothetical protein
MIIAPLVRLFWMTFAQLRLFFSPSFDRDDGFSRLGL